MKQLKTNTQLFPIPGDMRYEKEYISNDIFEKFINTYSGNHIPIYFHEDYSHKNIIGVVESIEKYHLGNIKFLDCVAAYNLLRSMGMDTKNTYEEISEEFNKRYYISASMLCQVDDYGMITKINSIISYIVEPKPASNAN